MMEHVDRCQRTTGIQTDQSLFRDADDASIFHCPRLHRGGRHWQRTLTADFSRTRKSPREPSLCAVVRLMLMKLDREAE